jgi:hypothetical protein
MFSVFFSFSFGGWDQFCWLHWYTNAAKNPGELLAAGDVELLSRPGGIR